VHRLRIGRELWENHVVLRWSVFGPWAIMTVKDGSVLVGLSKSELQTFVKAVQPTPTINARPISWWQEGTTFRRVC
jgi:hypothetical protein